MAILGIDTSAYTCSVAIVSDDGQVLTAHRRLLPVPRGERGLQQGTAVFHHVQILPEILTLTFDSIPATRLKGVAAATRPRPVAGSYMPVFTVAAGQGRILAAALQVPFLATTHQEGHIAAGLWSAGWHPCDPFMAVHLSGGTSEILVVSRKSGGFNIKKLGGTLDLHAGQLIDRVGVLMGLEFPAGPQLELLARQAHEEGEKKVRLTSAVRGYNFSFSGPASQAERLLAAGADRAAVARAVEQCIANTLERVLRAAIVATGIKDILIVGGVAANDYLRRRLRHRLEHRAIGAKLYFAAPEHSADNAIGVALLGREVI
ncbi:O-sialoglycoprotein endopeptidase [Moorella sulfitireducens (nom. illeg.)]|uniref:Kae1-like domain-containing protein n=1 Tax=Neomoorella sulfitireducens TaxID=2972948 RepID=UPI0021AD38F2|nr:O-sialoglycoprotein endopeptidase [Moorella sulfitireducens]